MSPYQKNIIVSVFVRRAQQEANPNDFLQNILFGKVDIVASGNTTVLISLTTGGSSGNWTLPANMSLMDVMEIAELALRTIETGIDAPLSVTASGTPVPNPIAQVAPSQRLVSYAQFGNVQR